MKVVYIGKGDWITISGNPRDTNDPIKDNIYTVVDTDVYMGVTYYQLKECGLIKYNADNFVPLDDYLEQFTESLTKELTEVEQLELI